jgi:transposase
MKYIKGQDRDQTTLFPISLDEAIDKDNEVRLIDAFVNSLKLEDYGFNVYHEENGRPAYHPSDLLKLYIYGYMNHIRSSRQLEKECRRNIEVMWLMRNLQPDHNTISNFRRDNPAAIKKVFRQTVAIAKYFNLIGGKLLAGDSTKLRAQNSKKNNYNQKKIDRHLDYIQNKLEEYENGLAESDDDDKQQIEKEIAKHKQRKEEYHKLANQLNDSGEKQISTSDPESRQMITRNNITEVAYNIQTTVDSKHNIPIDYKVTNENDSKAMGKMLPRAKSILGHNQFTALYDKGYHTGSEFALADRLGIETLVAVPTVAANAPNHAYNVENFRYDAEGDFYVCPQGQELHTTGTWHDAKTYKFKRYTTKACMNCPVKSECTKAKYGKGVQRSEYQEYINQNKQRIEQNKNYYRRRQAIVEHPYGTIKRQWGFSYIMTKQSIQRASADVGFIFTAYNLRRLINIIGLNKLINHLEALALIFYAWILNFKLILSLLKAANRNHSDYRQKTKPCLNAMILTKFITLKAAF